MSWSFFQTWNDSLLKREDRKVKPRYNIWASEMGGAYIDRYLKMTGVEPTNPPNPRSLRKFEAGNLWEWIVGYVLKRAGIFISAQDWVSYKYPELLEVTGKIDYMAGGNPDWKTAIKSVDELDLPDLMARASKNIINDLAKKYKFGLKKVVLEIKSCSSFMFDRYEMTKQANEHHVLQAYHYLKAKNMDEAHIVYVCKDDCRMIEFGVFHPSPVEEIYKADIKKMTEFINAKQRPEKEPLVDFDEESLRFSPNWKVMYSNYLTMLYGYKNQREFEDKYRPITSSWNRVVKRAVEDKNMTDLNKKILNEIKLDFPNIEEVIKNYKHGKELPF